MSTSTMRGRRVGRCCAGVLLVLLAQACGSARYTQAPPAEPFAPPPPPPPPPAAAEAVAPAAAPRGPADAELSLAQAEAALAAGERELRTQLGAVARDANKSEGSAASGSAAPSPAEPAASEDARRPPAKTTAPEQGPDCEGACRALQSMKRAADRVCALTQPADSHCLEAEQRVRIAQDRVAAAPCSCQE